MRTTSETSGTMLNAPTFETQESQEKTTTKRKGHEKILEEIIVENFPKMGKEISHPSPRNPDSLKQDKPKVKHTKTHFNQINEDQTQQILKAAREKQQIIHKGDSHKDNS